MKLIKKTLLFDRYCWEELASGAPATTGVFVVYSCDRKESNYPIANVLFARAAKNLAVGIQSSMANGLVTAEKNQNRRICVAYAVVEEYEAAIASASAIQYAALMLDEGMDRFRFFRYGDVDLTIGGKWAFRIPKTIKLNVNECLKKLTKNDLEAFRTIVIKTTADMLVRNASDTAEDEAPHGESWIEFWRNVVGHDEPKKCPKAMCPIDEHPFDGAHVVIKDDPKKNVYVMPLCKSCNRSRSEGYFSVQPGIEMIPVGEP